MTLQTTRIIKVVGLGVCDGDMSLRGAGVIDSADRVIVKTALTDTYKFFAEENIPHTTCDDLFATAGDYEALNLSIVSRILGFKERNIVYCVDGNGADDRSVILLAESAEIEIIPGVSRESVALNNSPAVSYTAISAYDVGGDKNFNYDKSYPLIIKEIDNVFIAGEVKDVLGRIVGDEQKVIFYSADKDGRKVENIGVYELDRKAYYDHNCGVYVPPIELTERLQHDFIDLMRIMTRLRGRNGCDWDREQTHKSIRKNAIEEAYELVDAIDNDDIDNIIEESGDVILQGVFHAVIGEDEGEFNAGEVLSALCSKLISRHTHIFGDVVASNAEEALKAWEAAKAKEKKTISHADKLLRIPRALPSGVRALKAQKIAAKLGLDFENVTQIFAKIAEEAKELETAGDAERESECGDLLFAVINALRFYGVDSETALNKSVNKFIKRVAFVEERLTESGIAAADAETLDRLWNAAKAQEIDRSGGARELFEYVGDEYDEDDEYDDGSDNTESTR